MECSARTPQGLLGFYIGTYGNAAGQVENVTSYRRATIIEWKRPWLRRKGIEYGFTLGTYINVPNANNTDLVKHEYGHVKQSTILGPAYLSVIAVPSLLSSAADQAGLPHDHDYFWTEVWANELGEPEDTRNYPRHYRWDPWGDVFTVWWAVPFLY